MIFVKDPNHNEARWEMLEGKMKILGNKFSKLTLNIIIGWVTGKQEREEMTIL